MAKKQVKISTEELKNLVDTDISLNFVMSNKKVILAKPVSLESQSLKVKNTKGHVLHLPLNQVEEIWAEEKVS